MTKQPTFWTTLRLLLGAARKRSTGRQKRQQELLSNRSGQSSTDWGAFGTAMAAIFMIAVNVAAAFLLRTAVTSAQRVEAEHGDKIVSAAFLRGVTREIHPLKRQAIEDWVFVTEARGIAGSCGGSQEAVQKRLRAAYSDHGIGDFLIANDTNGCAEAERQGKIAVSRTFMSEVAAVERANRLLSSPDDHPIDSEIRSEAGSRAEAEQPGKIPVSRTFLHTIQVLEKYGGQNFDNGSPGKYGPYSTEARRIAEQYGGSQEAIETRLRDAERLRGSAAFIANDDRTPNNDAATSESATPGISALATSGRFPAMIGSIVLLWWFAMLVFQGEGLELDIQRRRHPMWEWLFSHPVPPGAVFLAEMLSPIAANPIFWGAPLFVITAYSFVYDFPFGVLAGVLIGIPITIAAACLGKACEIAVTLRFSPRSRGAMIGFMSWIGYTSLMFCFLGLFFVPTIINAAGHILYPLTALPWPWLRFFLGGQRDGSWSFPAGLLACWTLSAIVIAGAIRFSIWGAQLGLSGVSSDRLSRPSRTRPVNFGKEPLYRKEFLWFIRDRSAIVQTILIPLTVASIQVFNMRGLLVHAQGAWNYLCGTAILFGTYFLWILGPKSLSSEGSALWIALTWPRGLESLLKAKAWLWSLISTGIVCLVLAYAALMFHADIWKIALVLIGWFFFSRSMAEKSVTLVTITSESGEVQKIPMGRRLAAQLGMLTFAIGIMTQQWHIAVMGIVYSWVTAAAMWQNFRARLPYLYDPWSEALPPPPTLMHAMISISILVECGAVVTGILLLIAGPQNIAIAMALSYGICSVAVSLGVISFLGERNVSLQDVIHWRSPALSIPQLMPALMLAAAGGIALGLTAHGYLAVLKHIPASAEVLRRSQEAMAKLYGLRISYAIMAVGLAPFAEEYLFRGLLFRALDREWGGWTAVVGSAAFFAVYHPALAWPPVFLLGVCNALIFKKSGRLAPAILLHMVYNAVVLM